MFGDLTTALVDEIGSLFMGSQQRIVFMCAPAFAPYEIVLYLESLGVACKPKSGVEIAEDGTRTATLYVSEGQYLYAAGLVQGMAPGSVTVLEPHNVQPIKPRYSWGKPNKSARGPVASFLRGMTWLMGFEAKTLPIKKGKSR